MTVPDEAPSPTVLQVTRELRSHYGDAVPTLGHHVAAAKAIVAMFGEDLSDVTITAAQQIRMEAVRLTLAHRMHDSTEKLISEALQIAKAVETGQAS